jgi:hypothetical protein
MHHAMFGEIAPLRRGYLFFTEMEGNAERIIFAERLR